MGIPAIHNKGTTTGKDHGILKATIKDMVKGSTKAMGTKAMGNRAINFTKEAHLNKVSTTTINGDLTHIGEEVPVLNKGLLLMTNLFHRT